MEEADVLPLRPSGRSFHDVAGHRNGRTPDLRLQAEPLDLRKHARIVVDLNDELIGQSEDPQLAMVTAHEHLLRCFCKVGAVVWKPVACSLTCLSPPPTVVTSGAGPTTATSTPSSRGGAGGCRSG